MYKSILLASLAASAVSAKQLFPGHNQIKRDMQARQTDTSPSALASAYDACMTDLASAYASLPTPPPVLSDWEATVVVSDPCAFTIPESISSVAAEYESEVEDWYSSNSAAIASALSECPTYSSDASYSDEGDYFSATDYTDACATATGGSGGGDSATGGAGGSDATTTKDSTTKDSTAKGTDTAATAATATTKGGSGVTAGSGGSTGTATAATAAATNAGPKESGALGVAAMAVVGVLGVVAAL